MAEYTHLNNISAQGSISSSAQGKLIGSFSTLPAASELNKGQIVLYTGESGTYIKGKFYVSDGSSWTISDASPSSVTVDSALSSTSTNPVQNKVVNSALSGKQDKLTFDPTPTSGSNNPVTSGGVYSAINGISAPSYSAGTGISISNGKISLATSGVTAGSKGSTTAVPIIKVDSYGRVTSLSTSTIYPPTSAGKTDQYWRSDGSGAGVWTTPATAPTSDSSTLITAGAVYTALQNIEVDTSDFYTKSEVDAIAQAFNKWDVSIVDSLPSSGTTGVMYLVPSSDGTFSEQYVWTGSRFTKVGNTLMTGKWVDQGTPIDVVFEVGKKYRVWTIIGKLDFVYGSASCTSGTDVAGTLPWNGEYTISAEGISGVNGTHLDRYIIQIDRSTNKLKRAEYDSSSSAGTKYVDSISDFVKFVEKWVE